MALQALSSPTAFKFENEPRTKRPRSLNPTEEEEYMALCLIMLARGPDSALTDGSKLLHKCSVCSKSFPSYHALGGHKSGKHHRKLNPAPAAVCGRKDKTHECSVCHRCFPTGQALGGHKRRHYEGGATRSKGATSSVGAGLAVGLRDFDLNLPALPEFGFGFDYEVESPLPENMQTRY